MKCCWLCWRDGFQGPGTALCSHIDGKCFCRHGWSGERCQRNTPPPTRHNSLDTPAQLSCEPNYHSNQPPNQPPNQPTNQPSNRPLNQPPNQPSNQPSNQTSNQSAHLQAISSVKYISVVTEQDHIYTAARQLTESGVHQHFGQQTSHGLHKQSFSIDKDFDKYNKIQS